MRIEVRTIIDAPREVCFDLARDIDFHLASMGDTGERAVGGVTSGHIGMGEAVTWEARHLGIRQRLTVRITEFDPPRLFRDRQVRGPFRSFDHLHQFDAIEGGTLMIDVLDFAAPVWLIGPVIERLVLARHLRRLLTGRGEALRIEAQRRHHTQSAGANV